MDEEKAHEIITKAGFDKKAGFRYDTNMSRYDTLTPEIDEASEYLFEKCGYEMYWTEDVNAEKDDD